MPFFTRFTKRWAATGVVAEPTDNQSDTGFSYLGNQPPTVEQFNALFQNLDDKDNWLYARLLELLAAGGVTPSAGNAAQLLPAARNVFARGYIAFTSSQSWIVPSNVTKVLVTLWGGGGGGGGSYGPFSAGSGGSAGGYSKGIFSVTPGATIFVTVGNGGIGAPSGFIYNAQAGSSSSFGTLCSATGGGPGVGGNGAVAASSSASGIGSGGQLNLPGGGGGFGQGYANGAMGGGIGGPAPFGGSPGYLSIGGPGAGGLFPGGGGTGGGMWPNAGGADSFYGGAGSPGLVIVEY